MLKKLLATTAISAMIATGAMAQTTETDTTNQPMAEQPASPDKAPAGGMEAQPNDSMSAPTGEAAEAPAKPMDASVFLTEQSEDQVQASSYIGQTVYNQSDEAVGDINDLLFKKAGGIDGAIIGVGGFLGIGEKNVAVKFSEIDIQTDEDGDLHLVIDGSKEALEAAPDFVDLDDQKAQAEAAAQQSQTESGGMGTSTGGAPATGEPAQSQ
ncbi:hypothetical protein J2R99_002548 [Rhodopseudomonas julia]|uniref:PRC-barrel domain-containing protein n=1 Tax=Rhodopseudomonas julia TaxID=200617 RepID=A0ABU0C9R9_9BRAD|nr:PRC-barrel domain-containing protein [Rhodopseudomonas julia]MDQ0326679.1 hypothetical protein [Rhodopseudomonas julia]